MRASQVSSGNALGFEFCGGETVARWAMVCAGARTVMATFCAGRAGSVGQEAPAVITRAMAAPSSPSTTNDDSSGAGASEAQPDSVTRAAIIAMRAGYLQDENMALRKGGKQQFTTGRVVLRHDLPAAMVRFALKSIGRCPAAFNCDYTIQAALPPGSAPPDPAKAVPVSVLPLAANSIDRLKARPQSRRTGDSDEQQS